MWPSGNARVEGRLGAARSGGPVAVELVVRVVSPNALTSPLTGARAAAAYCELVELVERAGLPGAPRGGPFEVLDALEPALGAVLLGGGLLVLADADGDEVSLVARRARFDLARPPVRPLPCGDVPPELAPLLRNATGRGTMGYREVLLRAGDKLRLRAIVEASQTVVIEGEQPGTRLRYVVRDDLGPVVFEEAPW